VEDWGPLEDSTMKIEEVEGIGEDMGGKLRAAGIATTDDLLMAGASESGRNKVEAMTGISGKQLLKWVNHVDLMRIPGVGSEYSDLLEAAGVDSPAELAQRNAANLAQTFAELDAARPNTVRRVPSEATVQDWIAAAKKLEAAVSH
jgi:predicted flap endonuclease-1-like 5' DNA nuclease